MNKVLKIGKPYIEQDEYFTRLCVEIKTDNDTYIAWYQAEKNMANTFVLNAVMLL